MPRPPPLEAPVPKLPPAQFQTQEQKRLAQKERNEIEKNEIMATLDAELAQGSFLYALVEPSPQPVQLAGFYPDADPAQSIEGEHEGGHEILGEHEMSPKSYEYHWYALVAYAKGVWDESDTFMGPHDGAARAYSKWVWGESGTPTASPHEASDSEAAAPPPSSVPLGTPSPSMTSSSKDFNRLESRESDAASSEASWGWTTVEGEWQSGARER